MVDLFRYIGVDKFYLRENGDSSAIAGDLQPYIDAGVVDFGYLDGPKHPTQTNWYNACSKIASKRYSWVAFIDLDEFIVVLNRCGP
jgi:Glycosyltransferase family 92